MDKTKSSIFYRSIVLVSFLVFWVSLETTAKDGKFPAGKNGTKGAHAAEWLESTGDEDNKRTYVGQSSRGGGRGRGRGRSGTGSECPPPRAQPTDPGWIYIIGMQDYNPYPPPPFVKVGYTNSRSQRIGNLQSGNPYRLIFIRTWWVCNKHEAENEAHDELDRRNLRVDTGGGTEWFHYLPHTGRSLNDIIRIVRDAIDPWVEEEPDLVESPINQNLAPNKTGAIMATNYGHLNQRFGDVYIKKWRQPLKGNVAN